MIMRYCPPFIFPHRVFLGRTENEIKQDRIKAVFGEGGSLPSLDARWLRGQVGMAAMIEMGIANIAAPIYYGFRTRDDQFLFYMTFEGQK